MKQRTRCRWHDEKTASLVRRKNDYFCYGVCNRAYTLEEVAQKGVALEYEEDDECKEDIQEKLKYIRSLPIKEIRGLRLPADERGYFIVWSTGDFYKYRRYNPGKGPKYIAPKGHAIPLFRLGQYNSKTIAIVEGEINAMSLALAFPEWDVCSPGSATKFNNANLSHHLTEFKRYSNVIVVLDNDAAGIKAYIEAKACFLYNIPFVSYILMDRDANAVLNEKGPVGLREEVQGYRAR